MITCSWLGCTRLGDTCVRDVTRVGTPTVLMCRPHAETFTARYPSRDPAPLPTNLPHAHECIVCGARFLSDFATGVMYCNPACKTRAARARLAEMPTRVCDHCGVEFRARNGLKTHCSKKCVADAYTARRRTMT